MPVAFVQSLLQGSSKTTGTTLVLSGSKNVTAGDTIFVAFGADPVDGTYSVADNLGNTYSLVGASTAYTSGGGTGARVRLWRADITNAGTLTTITITHPSLDARAAIATEFSSVGVAGTLPAPIIGAFSGSTSQSGNYYASDGGAVPYNAGDLWITAIAYEGLQTFSLLSTAGAIGGIEPTAEQVTSGGATASNIGIGFGYYIGAAQVTGTKARIIGSLSSSTTGASVIGAGFQVKVPGVVNNDTASGGVALTGTCVDSYQKRIVNSDAPTGALALSGSVVESYGTGKIYSDAPAGAVALTGSRTERNIATHAPTGVLALSGSVTESYGARAVYNDVCAGSVARGGAATDRKTHATAPSGVVALSGTVIRSSVREDAQSGSIALAGTVVESSFIRTGFFDRPTGRIGITGQQTSSLRFTDKPSGRVVIAGASTERNSCAESPTGRMRMYGWAAEPLPPTFPRPVGILGDLATSPVSIPTKTVVLRPELGSGWDIGDILVCFAVASGEASLNTSIPGWKVGVATKAPTGRTNDFYLIGKVVDSLDEISPTLTFTVPSGGGAGAEPVAARVVAFRGLDFRNFANIADVIGTVNTINSVGQTAGGAAITTIYDNDLVLSLTEREIGTTTGLTAPAGFGIIASAFVDSGARMTMGWAYHVQHPPGQSPAPQFGVKTIYGESYNSWGVQVALRSSPVGPEYSEPVGTITLSGSVTERKTHNDRPQGTISLSGSAQDDWKVLYTYFDSCAGTLRLSGSNTETYTVAESCSGTLLLSGRISEFIAVGGVIFYTDAPVGRIELSGRTIWVNETPTPGRSGRIVGALAPGRVVRALSGGRTLGNLTGRRVTG